MKGVEVPLQLKRGVLEIISKMKVDSDNILGSKIGQLIVAIKNNHKKQGEDRDIKALAIKIFNHWAQIISNTKPYYDGKGGGRLGKKEKYSKERQ